VSECWGGGGGEGKVPHSLRGGGEEEEQTWDKTHRWHNKYPCGQRAFIFGLGEVRVQEVIEEPK